jgi:cysteine desulfurase
VAADVVRAHLTEEAQRLGALRDKLENSLVKIVPETTINGKLDARVPNTTNICFSHTDSSAMVMALDLKGLSCSNGSACAAGNPEPSHVLLAMGLPQDKAHASLRFSVGWDTTEADIDEALKIIPEVVARLRQTNPLWKKAS